MEGGLLLTLLRSGGKEEEKTREKFCRNLQDFDRNSYFFLHAACGRVIENFKCFLLELQIGRRGNFSIFLQQKGKILSKAMPNLRKNNDFLV